MSDTDKPYRPGCSPPVVFFEKLVKLEPPVKQEVLDRIAKMPIFPVRVEPPSVEDPPENFPEDSRLTEELNPEED
jgi:hypothetical protein